MCIKVVHPALWAVTLWTGGTACIMEHVATFSCSRLQFLDVHTGLDFRQEYTYNNFMYMLTSCMAEKITGMEFEDIVQERIFDKLNMNDSVYISAIQDQKERVPTQYIWNYKTETMDRLDPDLLFAWAFTIHLVGSELLTGLIFSMGRFLSIT